MITVENIKNTNRPKHGATQIYIGRALGVNNGSPLANPFTMKDKNDDKERDEVISKYKKWIIKKLIEGNEQVRNELQYIAMEARRKDVDLLCYCAPKPCHGDVIKKLVEIFNEQIKE